ncbi:hypothetical protein [Streptomyces sp. LUP30]|nr:hypothetical protein [Streptomyces sp. LUP30]
MLLAVFFAVAAVGALAGLALVDWRTVQPVLGTGALVLTLAALAVAIRH